VSKIRYFSYTKPLCLIEQYMRCIPTTTK